MAELDYKNPKLIVESSKLEAGKVSWQSPSNIALIKYWGKHGVQLPNNPSISFTLNQAHSKTTLSYEVKNDIDTGAEVSFLFHGKPQAKFEEKIKQYFNSLDDIFPFIKQLRFQISSENSFPHSAGIASSASGMSALALCLCSLEDKLFGTLSDSNEFRKKASFISRLGSGSACRSIYSIAAVWGDCGDVEESSDLFAVPYFEKLHDDFHTIQDTILLISKSEKSVSSRAGHQLMENNLYAENRYTQARQRMHRLIPALESGDWETFGSITEAEALTLHALMMTSNPPYLLMQPNSLEAINRIYSYRVQHKIPMYFTLDAGPNIHLLYPASVKEQVLQFIQEELAPLCHEGQYITDHAGNGPIEF